MRATFLAVVALAVGGFLGAGCGESGGPNGPGTPDAAPSDKKQHEDSRLPNPDADAAAADLTEALAEDLAIDMVVPPETLDFAPLPDLAGELEEAVGPQCEPGEGCFADGCIENGDCLSGYCVEHLGEMVCSQTCVEECPAGFACVKVGGAEPDAIYACLSPWPRLCLPCTANQDCKTPDTLGALCVTPGGEGTQGEYFCGTSCQSGSDCPAGYECQEVTTQDGMYATQCVPAGGTCACTGLAVSKGLYTTCEQINEWGTCKGFRKCGPEGLAPCDAALPSEEVCDGLDNDCDSASDEETCDDGNPCTDDLCNGEDGCLNEPATAKECTDADLCTTGDHCVEGACIGNPIQCDDGNPCTDDSCDPTGTCVAEPNHELCNDGNPCTLADLCDEGVCKGTPISCDCQSDSECQAIDDGNACNGVLYCNQKVLPYKCEVLPGSIPQCTLPAEADPFCQKAECAPATGSCSTVPNNEGFACNDNNLCTMGEQCQEGACTGGATFSCNDDNQCTMDTCKADSGCLHISVAGACDDGNPCTIGDSCTNGKCLSGPQMSCDDKNPCTADACDPDLGCTYANLPADCDDGNPCTMDDHCSNGACIAGGATDCADANQCTTDTCEPLFGCVHTQNNLPCDDGNLCTTQDTCQKGACKGTGSLKCDDGNLCTDDSCNPATGCQFLANAAACDDKNLCTVGDHCEKGACVPVKLLDCDDDNVCTDDACFPDNGCSNQPNQDKCNDGNPCSALDQCQLGQCKGAPYACDDKVECTLNQCDGAGGCFHPVAPAWCLIGLTCVKDAAANPDNACQGCVAAQSTGSWTPLDGKPCGQVPNASTHCQSSKCVLKACSPGFDDCDELLDTGCETAVLADNSNCGQCNKACDPPKTCNNGECSFICPEGKTNCGGQCVDPLNDALNCNGCGKKCMAATPDKIGVCAAGKCAEMACPANQVNINLDPADGCEYECAKTNNGIEVCDGFDNDCDKQTDEGFDLQTDLANCGQCGKKCGPYLHVKTALCNKGICAIGACEEGYSDKNGNVLDGCEEKIATGELWVDAWNFADPLQDGTKAHPFDLLEEALAVAKDGELIRVLEGSYSGNQTAKTANVTISGAGKEAVFIVSQPGTTGIKVTAGNVTIKGLTLSGGQTGVHFATVTGGKLQDLKIAQVVGATNQEGKAVFIDKANGIVVDGIEIDGVTGGPGSSQCCPGNPGKTAAGVMVSGATGTVIKNSKIHAIAGGIGGNGTSCCGNGGQGGLAAGIYFSGTSNNSQVEGNAIYNVRGGKGGVASCCGDVGPGNTGAGIFIQTGSGLWVTANLIYDIAGGKNGSNAASGWSACLLADGAGAVMAAGLTCVGVNADPNQMGVWLEGAPLGPAGVASSIFAGLTGYGVYNKGGNNIGLLNVSYSDFFGCAKGTNYNSTVTETCITVDPQFVNEANKDFHLKNTSPCIDAGKPSADYCNEPNPNGCRVDLGAYGNTAAATPKAGAQHCACNP